MKRQQENLWKRPSGIALIRVTIAISGFTAYLIMPFHMSAGVPGEIWRHEFPGAAAYMVKIGYRVDYLHPNISVVDNDTLVIYYPHYSKLDLVCGTMPSPEEESVIFCCEAAFTGRERLDTNIFLHSHIAGNHVSRGVLYKGYKCVANTGCFAYYADSGRWRFAHEVYAQCLDTAAAQHGMAFGQTMIIYDGKDVHAGKPCKDTSRNQYRALCEIDGKLCIADAKYSMAYIDFIRALQKAGAKYAVYLDMGKGWNCSFYRDNEGNAVYIHSERIQFTTNWLTFYR